jgi:hypothetical protein
MTPRVLCLLLLSSVLVTAGCPAPSATSEAGPETTTPEAGPQPSGRPSGTSPSRSAAPPAGSVDCAHSIDHADTPPVDYEVVLDAVALPTRRRFDARPSGDGIWRFAKQGLLVRSDAAVDLTVAPAAAGRAWIGWGSPAEPASRVHVPACGGPYTWIVFVGGFWITQPTCVPVVVRAGGRSATIRFAVDTYC